MRILLAAVAVGAWAVGSVAVEAQTVQLPTFNRTTVNTTVSVPDRGQALLGGISRSSTGRTDFGVPGVGKLPFGNRPFRNSAIGGQRSGGNMSVTATIHDLEAMDQALLQQAAAARGGGPSLFERQEMLAGEQRQRAAFLDRVAADAAPQAAAAPERTVADVLRERAAERSAEQFAAQQKWADFLVKGRQAEAAGKTAAAKIYYRTVMNNAHGDLRELGAARLAALTSPGTSALARDQ